jgi:serine protease Do
MRLPRYRILAALLMLSGTLEADNSFDAVAGQVNKKLVKLFGAGGFQGLTSYGTGVLVSPEGHILTVASHMLTTQELRVHLYDGRRFHAQVLVVEPELDAALIKMDKVEEALPYYDITKAAAAPLAQPGDWVLAFSNQFQIATRDEPMSVQRGVIAAFSRLQGRRGVFDAPYTGEVYVIDAITNNPGAGGGVVTTRQGELVGIIGKELRNSLTDTWINYAVPVSVLASFVEKAKKGEYKPVVREKPAGGPGGYHGIVLVPNVIERTPPYIEEIVPGSPAAKVGLRPDDLIVYVDGEQIVSVKAFRDLIAKTRPGTVLRLEVQRTSKEGGERLVPVEIKLDEQPKPKTQPRAATSRG